MPGSALPFARCFHGLDAVVDEVHALFASWAEQGTLDDTLNDDGLYVLQLAVHEWIANIVQHAAFGGRVPVIAVTLAQDGDGLRCVIEDNSDGFDFERQIGHQQALAAAPEPGERGRGLLMLIACTEDLSYEQEASGRQRLGFVVRSPIPADAFVLLFPSSDDLGADALGADALEADPFRADAFGADPFRADAFGAPEGGGYPTEPAL